MIVELSEKFKAKLPSNLRLSNSNSGLSDSADNDDSTKLPDIIDIFSYLQKLPGKVYSEGHGRLTKRILVGDEYFFVKLHFGVGWREIFKNLLHFKLPVVSARTEKLALQFLAKIKVPSMQLAGFGEMGVNPAKCHSFIITEELKDTKSLEIITNAWLNTPPEFKTKLKLIKKLALLVKRMHENGLNHRDCYLCHFHLDNQEKLYVIDLHRAQIRKKVPRRWLIKDLAALYFSSMHLPISERDRLRFLSYYCADLKTALADKTLWQQVIQRAKKLRHK